MRQISFILGMALTAVGWSQVPVPVPLNTVPSRIVGHPHAEQLTVTSVNPNLVEGREFFQPQGIAVDTSVTPPILYVADAGNNRVVKLSPSLPSGSLGFSPATGPAGSPIGVTSVTACPVGGTFGSSAAKLSLTSSAGTAAATATAPVDAAGNWTGTLTVTSLNGTPVSRGTLTYDTFDGAVAVIAILRAGTLRITSLTIIVFSIVADLGCTRMNRRIAVVTIASLTLCT